MEGHAHDPVEGHTRLRAGEPPGMQQFIHENCAEQLSGAHETSYSQTAVLAEDATEYKAPMTKLQL